MVATVRRHRAEGVLSLSLGLTMETERERDREGLENLIFVAGLFLFRLLRALSPLIKFPTVRNGVVLK